MEKDIIQNIKDIIRTILEIEILFKKYKISNSKNILTIKNLKLLSIKGHEYLVFLYNDQVIKIHRNHLQVIYSLNERNILSLSKIETKRILMPTSPVYNIEGSIEGYSMQPVLREKDISNESMDHFFNEIYIINDDMNTLNDNSIILKDLHPGNAIYNGKIFIVDSGRYLDTNIKNPFNLEENNKSLQELVKENNLYEINYFLYSFIMNKLLKGYSKEEKKLYLSKINSYLKKLAQEMGTNSYLNVIESICSRNMTVYEFSEYLFQKQKILIQ